MKTALDKFKVQSEGLIYELPGGFNIYVANGENPPSYGVLTKKRAWCDTENFVHLGKPKEIKKKKKEVNK